MEETVKICPNCGAEFFPHIESCNSCEVRLVYPWEKEELERSRIDIPETQEGEPVLLEEGSFARIRELSSVLEAVGISFEIMKLDCGDACSKGGGFGLFVPEEVSQQARMVVEEHWLRLHPELRETREKMGEGRCPACGHPITGSPEECPDCGLNLNGAPQEGCVD